MVASAPHFLADSVHWGTIFSTLAAWISALSSVAVVVVALLFREEVRAARRRPSLSLLFAPGGTSDHLLLTLETREERWVRFRVRNEPGRETAVGVQLLLLEVRGDGDESQAVPTRPFRVTDTDGVRVDVAGGIERRFDILHVERPHGPDGEAVRQLVLGLEPPSQVRRDHLRPGVYRLTLGLLADNCDATYWNVTFRFEKPWAPGDAPEDSVVVAVPSRTTPA